MRSLTNFGHDPQVPEGEWLEALSFHQITVRAPADRLLTLDGPVCQTMVFCRARLLTCTPIATC
jgi:hypothetical protein